MAHARRQRRAWSASALWCSPPGSSAAAEKAKEPLMSLLSVPRKLAGDRDIFCNRELNMKQIKAIGFDMDYTLAQYYSSFDLLAFEGAKDKLVNRMRYPEAVLGFDYNPSFFARGLVIDKQRGNIIKMDRHKYVRVAYHGFEALSSEERKRMYITSSNRMTTFTGPNYVNMDTLFSLVDAVLFAHLVDYKDTHPGEITQSYETIFNNVRACVDLCHRDGVIKDRVAQQPEDYIMPDPDMVPMLRRFKEEGIKVFLLTNSLWDYTNVVMNYLCGNPGGQLTTDWLDLFDVAITGSCKPAFLVDTYRDIFRVNTEGNLLSNTDGVIGDTEAFLKEGKVFQGGNYEHLHELLHLDSGDQLLYVGDHMFSDILRSKRTLGWRTCLIVPELEGEMRAHRQNDELRKAVNDLRILQYDLDECLDMLRLRAKDELDPEAAQVKEEVTRLEEEQAHLKAVLAQESLRFHSQFHPAWGQLFKSGYQDSRFATQVATYACIYTSKASNLAQVSRQRSFRPVRDVSPHDLLLDVDRKVNLDLLRETVVTQGLHIGDRLVPVPAHAPGPGEGDEQLTP